MLTTNGGMKESERGQNWLMKSMEPFMDCWKMDGWIKGYSICGSEEFAHSYLG